MPVSSLPEYLLCRKGIFSLFRDPHTGKRFDDDRSLFRCVALHRSRLGFAEGLSASELRSALDDANKSIELRARLALDDWLRSESLAEADFRGVALSQMPSLEKLFNLDIFVYRFIPRRPRKDKEANVVRTDTDAGAPGDLTEIAGHQLRRYSQCVCEYHPVGGKRRGRPEQTLCVNVYTDEAGTNHFAYIADLDLFAKVYECEKCFATFSTRSNLQRHAERPDCRGPLHRFPGNGAVLEPTLFESLDEAGIHVDEERRYTPYYAVYDCETCQETLAHRHAFRPLYPKSLGVFPEREDPVLVPAGARPFERLHWAKIRTQKDPQRRFCVVRGARLRQVRELARWLAEKQTGAFHLYVKILCRPSAKGVRLSEELLVYFPFIDGDAKFEECAEKLLTYDYLKEYYHRVAALRIECVDATETRVVTAQELVSVAVATNVEGFAPAFLCRTEDDAPVATLVHSFADHLHAIQTRTAELMHARFAPELAEMDRRVAERDRQCRDIVAHALTVAQERLAALEQEQRKAAKKLDELSRRRGCEANADAQALTLNSIVASVKQAEGNVVALEGIDLDKKFNGAFRLKKQQLAALDHESRADFFVCNGEAKRLLRLRKELTAYCDVLPVLGFNSGRFDMKLLRPWLIPYLQEQQLGTTIYPLKKGGTSYLALATKRLRFLDVSNYLAPFTSYESWVAAYTSGRHAKGIFCYEYLSRPSQLLERALPPREAFDSSLKGTRCSEAEYAEAQRVWREQGMQTLGDYLRYYNLLDVVPFVEALESMRSFWREQGHDMFHKVCTLPGLADRFVRTNFLPKHTNLVLPQKQRRRDGVVAVDNSDLYYLLKRSIIGGPSGPYHRLHIAGETKIRGGPETCGAIVGIDCTAMYLDASSKPMPTQIPVRYAKAHAGDAYFKRTPLYRHAQSQLEWLEWIMHTHGITIRHQFNSDKAPYIGGQRPDGYHAASKTAFYFDGCRYHGHGGCCANPESRFADDVEPERRRKRDWAIRRKLVERGYSVLSIRECEWMKLKHDNKRASELNGDFAPPQRRDGTAYDPRLREFLAEHLTLPRHGRMSDEDLLREVWRGRFFGVLVCDVDVPPELREHFADFEPIFKHAEVSRADLSEHMRAFVESVGELQRPQRPQRVVVNSFFARDFVLTTPLAIWYLNHGLRISNVTQAFEWKPKAMYERFAETVAEERRKADANFAHAIKGNLFKLAGNSIYGKTVTNVDDHVVVQVCDEETLEQIVTERFDTFKTVDPLGDNAKWFEVHTKKTVIDHKLDTAFGAFVYQYAKLRLLQAYYDYLDFYWERRDYQLMYVDTDSLYFAISTRDLPSFSGKVRPELRHLFDSNYPEQFMAREDPAKYTPAEIAFDRRKAGLFHLETLASRMCALNAKCYVCTGIAATGDDDLIVKQSAKGVTRAFNHLEWSAYYDVLRTMRDFVAVSRTLRRPHGRQEVCRVDGFKRALTYGFFKRQLAADGITTSPLGL